MENNILIEPSLQKKIKQNDIKIKLLLNKGLLHNNNNDNEESSQDDSSNKGYGKTNSEIKIKEDKALLKNIKKIMKFKVEKEEKKCNTNYFGIKNNNEKFEKKEKKKLNNNNINKAINRLYNNDYKNKKIIKREGNKKEKNNKTFSNYKETIERFEKDIEKRYQNLNKQKIEIEKKNKKKYTYIPNIGDKNKKYNDDKIKDNFFERQKIFMERKEQKKEQLKDKIKKEEEKLQSAPSYKVKKDIIEYLNNFDKWEKERIDKIEKMKKEREEKLENEFDYKPKIDEKSVKIVEKNKLRKKQPNTFLRLSQQDKILKEKKKILIDMYTPSFKPFCYEPKNINLKNIQKRINITEPEIEKEKIESVDEDSDEEKENEEEESEEKLDEFDYQQDIMKFTDKEVEDVVRNNLFHYRNNSKK